MDNKTPTLQIKNYKKGEIEMKILNFFRALLLMVTVLAGLSLDSASFMPAVVFVSGGVLWLVITAFTQPKEATER